MIRKSEPFGFVCRLCRQQAKRNAKQGISQKRTFSSTISKCRTIPSFEPTTSSEFDALLLDYRRRVFTPAALSQTHRRLIRRESNHELIKTDPGVTVTLSDEEEIKLEPLHDWDRPKRKQSLDQFARLLGQTEDNKAWENLIPFLEGMKMAHEPANPDWLERITRKANETGHHGIIIEAARRVKDTKLSLSTAGVTRELMLGFHNRAIDSRCEDAVLTKALHQATVVARLLESDGHCRGRMSGNSVDMRRDITVLGVLLELNAADAIHTHEKEAGSQVMKDYATKILAMTGTMAFGPRTPTAKQPESYVLGHFIKGHLPLWNGLGLAQQVTGVAKTPLAGELNKLFSRIDGPLKEAYNQLQQQSGGKPRRALKMYDAVKK